MARIFGCIIIINIILMTVSCSPFAPKLRISPEGSLPSKFSIYDSKKQDIDNWWEEFNNIELNLLIQEALSGNFSIKEAWARLKQARALSMQARSGLFPDLSFNLNTSQSHQQIDNNTKNIENYSLGFSSSYELDIWGRIHSEQEAASLEEKATKENLNAAAMTITALVVENWINIISQRMQKKLLYKQLKTDKMYLELVELRFRKGVVSALDVYQQRQTVEQIKAKIPLIKAQEQILMNELALLLGRPPASKIQITQKNLPVTSKIPQTGLPADILASRPDVRAAGLRLYAADWQVSAAKAKRLPSIKLTGSAGFGSDKLDILFDNWLLNLAANLTAPVFDGKRRAAEVERTKAKADENLWAYRNIVYTAVKEAENALIREKRHKEHIQALKQEINVAKKALNEATARYRKGISDYLPVLTQLLSLQNLEQDMIKRKTELLVYRINLYRALGGGIQQL